MRQTTVAWYVTTPWGRLETLHQEGAVVTVSGQWRKQHPKARGKAGLWDVPLWLIG